MFTALSPVCVCVCVCVCVYVCVCVCGGERSCVYTGLNIQIDNCLMKESDNTDQNTRGVMNQRSRVIFF